MKLEEGKNLDLVKDIKRLFSDRFAAKSRAKKGFSMVDIMGAFDFKIRYSNRNLAYVKITEDLNPYVVPSVTFKLLGFSELLSDSLYLIITDSRTFLIWSDTETPVRVETIDELYKIMVTAKRDSEDYIKNEISKLVYNFILEARPSLLHKASIEYSEDLISQLDYDGVINQANFIPEFEIDVFGSLLDDVPEGGEVYRYSSLSTLLNTIENCKYRLNCIVAMNDRSEINYVDRYLNNNLDLHQVIDSEVKYANKRFISSLTERKDDLTLWRMYTDNASGVCMVFKAVSNPMFDGCFLKKVSYAKSNNRHDDLDVLKNLMDRLKATLKVDFKFYTLYIWKHFFKPYEYSDEKEVRLLYYSSQPKRSWGLNTQNGIVSPYVEFDLFGALPIELQSVILGPRLAESEVNKVQIEEAIVDSCGDSVAKKRKRIKVSLSKIKSYR